MRAAAGGVLIRREQAAARPYLAQGEPSVPQPLERINRRLRAARSRSRLLRALRRHHRTPPARPAPWRDSLRNPRPSRSVPPRHRAPRAGEGRRVLGDRQRIARIRPRLYREQESDVGDAAPHRPLTRQLLHEDVVARSVRHAAGRRSEAEHGVERGRIAQRPHHVAAVAAGSILRRQRGAGAAARSARRLRGIPRHCPSRRRPYL